MSNKNYILIIVVLFVSSILSSLFVSGDMSGYTITGTITVAGKNAEHAAVKFHSTALGDCECTTSATDYSSKAGIYTSSADNLIVMADCTSLLPKGESCAPFISGSDRLWITVDGSTVIPVSQGEGMSDSSLLWNSYIKEGTVYFGVDADIEFINEYPPEPEPEPYISPSGGGGAALDRGVDQSSNGSDESDGSRDVAEDTEEDMPEYSDDESEGQRSTDVIGDVYEKDSSYLVSKAMGIILVFIIIVILFHLLKKGKRSK